MSCCGFGSGRVGGWVGGLTLPSVVVFITTQNMPANTETKGEISISPIVRPSIILCLFCMRMWVGGWVGC